MTDDTIVKAPKTVRPIGSEYVILELDSSGYWTEHSSTTARDAETAIRKHVDGHGNEPGTYVAVPRKSWKPLTVKAETVTTLKLEEVT